MFTKKLCSQFYFLVLLLLGFHLSLSGAEQDKYWNALIFSQQWPITSCIDHLIKNPDGYCNLYLNMTSWGIHGIWPTDSGKIGPNFCNYTWHFKEDKIKDIEPFLLKYWPNIFGETSTVSFWKHEWEKHGTCAAELITLDSEYKYFSKGLELVIDYDVVSILGIHEIYPSDENPYNLEDIISALESYLKKTPIIDCTYNSKLKRHELSQIKICFNRKFAMMDCDDLKNFESEEEAEDGNKGNCPPEGVYYPASVKMLNTTYNYSNKLALHHTSTWVQQNMPTWLGKLLQTLKGLSLISIY